jgi:hypothetical protein
MSDQFENLNDVFNVSGEIVKNSESEVVKDPEKIELVSSQDIEKDYEYTRGNLYSLIEKGQEAINGVLELAQETESPRAYEVFGQLIKNVSDTTDKLINLQQKMKELDETNKSSSPTTVNNTLFVGSTAELSKMLKSQIKELDDK